MSYKEEYLFNCHGSVIIKNSKLVDCAYLFMAYQDFYLNDCEIADCASGTIHISTDEKTKVSICDNMIRQSTLKQFYCDDLSRLRSAMIEVSRLNKPCTNFQFSNNVIKELDSFSTLYKDESSKFVYIKAGSLIITQSSFYNVTGTISVSSVSECYFRGCKNSIENHGLYNNLQVDNCIFEECQDVISCGERSKITNCQFVSCKNKLVNSHKMCDGGVIVENCVFKNITNDFEDEHEISTERAAEYSALYFTRNKGWDSMENKVCNCVFDGISMNKAFLIACNGVEKPNGDVVTVSKCTFSHCETKRQSKKLIKEFFSYYGAFSKKKSVNATKMSNCTGIERFNTEGCAAADLSINHISTFGRKIGADDSMTDRIGILVC